MTIVFWGPIIKYSDHYSFKISTLFKTNCHSDHQLIIILIVTLIQNRNDLLLWLCKC